MSASSSTRQEKIPGPFEITITAYRCRCGYEWTNRKLGDTTRPRVCPHCKSANWDQPKRLFRRKKVDDLEKEEIEAG